LVKPGLTGLAQVSGARGETPTVESMSKRIEYDLEYIETATMLLDLQIIMQTLREVFMSKHAY
jgi:putative colanic acid biosynthesis UDP-glucose lipid carrier transferase